MVHIAYTGLVQLSLSMIWLPLPNVQPVQMFSSSPRNFDECIFVNMRGVTSDMAARAVYASCRSQFPEQRQSEVDLSDIMRGRIEIFGPQLTAHRGNPLRLAIYHTVHDVIITSITIRISSGSISRDFRCDALLGVRALTEGEVTCHIIIDDMDKLSAQMRTIAARGRRIGQ